jgi:hypothetical protein
MTTHLALMGLPVLAGLLIRLTRRSRPWPTTMARDLRDLLTLRMVLRDSEPLQRSQLLAAHHAWRTEPPQQPGQTQLSQSETST